MKKYLCFVFRLYFVVFCGAAFNTQASITNCIGGYDQQNLSDVFYKPVSRSQFYRRDGTGPFEIRISVLPNAKLEDEAPYLSNDMSRTKIFLRDRLTEKWVPEKKPARLAAWTYYHQILRAGIQDPTKVMMDEDIAKIKAHIHKIMVFSEKRNAAFREKLKTTFEEQFAFKVDCSHGDGQKALVILFKGHEDPINLEEKLSSKSPNSSNLTEKTFVKTEFVHHISQLNDFDSLFDVTLSDLRVSVENWVQNLSTSLSKGEHRKRY